jgi:tRNA (guanine37-N1)-methyltransferase
MARDWPRLSYMTWVPSFAGMSGSWGGPKHHRDVQPAEGEGVDQRAIDMCIDEVISIGEYILTGGEIPAMVLVDCVARLVAGVLSDPECHEKESISSGLLECPQYTKPFNFMGREVPEVLISGHHANIEKWRREKSLRFTAERRPDLLEKNIDKLDERDLKFLRENNLFGVIDERE